MPRITILVIFSFALAACNTLAPNHYSSSRGLFATSRIPDLSEYASVYDDNVAYGVDSRIAHPQTPPRPSRPVPKQAAQPQIESTVTAKPKR